MEKERTEIKIPSARQVRAIRAWMGMLQPDFAKACSVSHSALADYELARRRTSSDVLQAIAMYVATLPVKWNQERIVLDA